MRSCKNSDFENLSEKTLSFFRLSAEKDNFCSPVINHLTLKSSVVGRCDEPVESCWLIR